MTMQEADLVIYKNKKYYLIDVEYGKHMINPDGYAKNDTITDIFFSSSCWRGYVAKYRVKDNKLFLTLLDDKKQNDHILFSGTFIIVRGNKGYFNTDFLESIFLFNEAIELVFDKGILLKENSLKDMLDEYERDITLYGDSLVSVELKNLVNSHCIGKYGEQSYKWND